MRIESLSISNIAGLTDLDLDFGESEIVALAGPNGSGKSTLLACLLAPWLQNMPAPMDGEQVSTVLVRLKLSDKELRKLQELETELDGNPGQLKHEIEFRIERKPLSGNSVQWTPQLQSLQRAFSQSPILERIPELDVLYLPAERRFAPRGSNAVDVSLAARPSSQSTQATRGLALQEAGHFDDNEFNTYASALAYAAALEGAQGSSAGSASAAWGRFRAAINDLIAPKELLGPTPERPDRVLVRLPDGSEHDVQGLSSGERQALTLLSRAIRAGQHRTITIVDEPDAFLHPRLTAQLMAGLSTEEGGQLFVATHSPAILDNVAVGSIYELRPGRDPRPVLSEEERVDMYRSAGFRASELTQAELFVMTEGETDQDFLVALDPVLSRAAFKDRGGRAEVLRVVTELSGFDLPVLGVIDRDIEAEAVPVELSDFIYEWPSADIEACILSDPNMIATMVGASLVNPGVTTDQIEAFLTQARSERRENAIAELAGRRARRLLPNQLPSPKGDQPIDRLKTHLSSVQPVDISTVDDLIATAEHEVDASTDPWKFHRGKPIANTLANGLTPFKTGFALLRATIAASDEPFAASVPLLESARAKLS